MPKCDFIENNFIEITFRHGCSPVDLLHIFRTPFPRNTFEWLLLTIFPCCRSSRPRVFCKKGLLKNYSNCLAKFTKKHLCHSFFQTKLEAQPETLIKKRLQHRCLRANIAIFLGTVFWYRTPPAAVSVQNCKRPLQCLENNFEHSFSLSFAIFSNISMKNLLFKS